MTQEHEGPDAVDPGETGSPVGGQAEQVAPPAEGAPEEPSCGSEEAKHSKKKRHTIKVDEEQYKALEAQAQKAQENYDKYVRTYADLENYRKRVARELQDLRKFGSEPVLADLLPVLDNFERALEAARSNAQGCAITDGVGMILRQLKGVLQKHGIEEMDPIHQPFDPARHQAIGYVETAEHPDHTVVEVVRRGYLFHGRVLQAATVNISVTPKRQETAEVGTDAGQMDSTRPDEMEPGGTDMEEGG